MDSGSLTIGAILIAICIIPFVVLQFRSKKQKLTLIDNLRAKAKEVSAIINKYEICGSFILGIDEHNNFIFFHQEEANTVNDQHVNLQEIKECKVLSTVKSGGRNQLIEKLELSFIPKNKSAIVPTFELFNENSDSEIGSQLLIAKEWAEKINRRLSA